jgi:polyhydroxyalkanoate synthesis regulator protein
LEFLLLAPIDPAGRRYVAIEELRQWRRDGVAFKVIDAETGAEVTRALLA